MYETVIIQKSEEHSLVRENILIIHTKNNFSY